MRFPAAQWAHWSTLQRLDVSANQIAGALPPEWAGMRSLRELHVRSNRVQGLLPSEWGRAIAFEVVDVSDNQLSGALPVEWASSSIRTLLARANQLFGTLPSEWTNWSNLVALDVSSNQITGALPRAWAAWNGPPPQSLTVKLSANRIDSELPPEWSNWTALRALDVSANRLSGPLPRAWASVPWQSLDLSFNQLSGTLPIEWAAMASMQNLSLNSNHLAGGLPASWNAMRALRRLSLQRNEFADRFPSAWASLPALQLLDLSGNCVHQRDANDTPAVDAFIAARNASLAYLDMTPQCLAVAPLQTTFPLAQPWTYRAVNEWGVRAATAVCWTRYCNVSTSSSFEDCIVSISAQTSTKPGPAARGPTVVVRVLMTRRAQSSSTNVGVEPIDFLDSCFGGLYRPLLECYLNRNGTVPCQEDATHDQLPSWHNQTRAIPFLPNGAVLFEEAVDAVYRYGMWYRIRFELGINLATGRAFQFTSFSPLFEAPSCPLESSIAIAGTTSCAPCPRFARCDGSTRVSIGRDHAWRVRTDVLPLYRCDREATEGCMHGGPGGDNQSDATRCRPNYRGAMCMSCYRGYTKVDATCVECMSPSVQVALFVLGIVLLLVAIFVVIRLSVTAVKERSVSVVAEPSFVAAASSDACCATSCLDQRAAWTTWFQENRAHLDSAVVVLKQLLNHFSFVGALSRMRTAQLLPSAIRFVLSLQHRANSFVFGHSATGLTCLVADASETTVAFNGLWAVFGGVFLLETLVYLAMTRHPPSVASVALFLVFLAHAPLTEAATRLLSGCTQFAFWDQRRYLQFPPNFDRAKFAPDHSISLLSSDLSQNCDEAGFRSFYVVGAVLTIAVVSIGAPIAAAIGYKYLTPKRRSDDAVVSPEEQRVASGRIALRKEVFSFLSDQYRPEVWYFELIVFGRKLVLALLLGALPEYPAMQLHLFNVVCLVMLVLSFALRPAAQDDANTIDQLSIAASCIAASMMSYVDSFETSSVPGIVTAVTFLVTQTLVILGIIGVYSRGFWRRRQRRRTQASTLVLRRRLQAAEADEASLQSEVQRLRQLTRDDRAAASEAEMMPIAGRNGEAKAHVQHQQFHARPTEWDDPLILPGDPVRKRIDDQDV